MPAERAYVLSMPPTQMTAEELRNASIPNQRTELVRGVLVVRKPPGGRHGSVTINLALRIGNHVERTGGGQVFAAETGHLVARPRYPPRSRHCIRTARATPRSHPGSLPRSRPRPR